MAADASAFLKDPNARLNYTIDWAAWLNEGDTIASALWTTGDGITASSPANTGTTCTIILTGGTAGVAYEVTNRITTTAGLIDDRTLTIIVTER